MELWFCNKLRYLNKTFKLVLLFLFVDRYLLIDVALSFPSKFLHQASHKFSWLAKIVLRISPESQF